MLTLRGLIGKGGKAGRGEGGPGFTQKVSYPLPADNPERSASTGRNQ